jgi:hypothetical protein
MLFIWILFALACVEIGFSFFAAPFRFAIVCSSYEGIPHYIS